MKRPAFQFYPGDWLRSADLRSCSVGARGLWIEMICLMHDGSPYGYLKVNNKVILPHNLARMVGATTQEVEGWLAELSDAGVYSLDGDCIYSRRMVKDEEIRAKRAAGGHLGGNPALLNQENKVPDKVNLPPNLEPTPAFAFASASALEETMSSSQAKPDPVHRLNGKKAMIAEVAAYLNLQAQRNFRIENPNGTPTAGALVIEQRLKEGYTVAQCKDVIGVKSNEWMGDEKMHQHLNPETLFRKKNFTKYLAQAEAAIGEAT